MSDFQFVRVRNTQSTLIIVKKIFLGRQIQKVASVQKISKHQELGGISRPRDSFLGTPILEDAP